MSKHFFLLFWSELINLALEEPEPEVGSVLDADPQAGGSLSHGQRFCHVGSSPYKRQEWNCTLLGCGPEQEGVEACIVGDPGRIDLKEFVCPANDRTLARLNMNGQKRKVLGYIVPQH